MPQIPKHCKVKRPTVLIKRVRCLKSFPKNISHKPLCDKLKSNNSSLAKALSKEKQENKLLFSQNVALLAEVQNLEVICNKRDAVISNILKNAKEMLKMLVTMTGYLTNTISSCQEFIASPAVNSRLSCSSTGRRDSCRRLSGKSPTRGVVKPMVSGHTITKPTINLSRVNMQTINNPSNLSIIEEVVTPPRNQEINNSRSSANVSMRPRRSENARPCRMPERLTVTSPRSSDENERRLSKRSRLSGRISGKFSRPKSSRLSGTTASRRSVENFEYIGSPTVKLNDVSKILRNSQSINIRTFTENQNGQVTESPKNRDNLNEDAETGITIPETPPTDGSNENDDHNNVTSKNKDEETTNEEFHVQDGQTESNSTNVQNLSSNWEDPLEGPSWLFNDSQTVPSENKKTDDDSSDDSMYAPLNQKDSSNMSDNNKSMQQSSPLPTFNKRSSYTYNSKSNNCSTEDESTLVEQNEPNDTICNASSDSTAEANSSGYKVEDEPAMNLANFVTRRRGCPESEDEDDFTLMLMRQPRNLHFDINDLKLPVLEESVIKPIALVEPEPEITTTVRKISHIYPMPSVSNNTLDESIFNQSTVTLPVIMNNDYEDNDTTPERNISEPQQRKKGRKGTSRRRSNYYIKTTPTHNKNNNQKSKRTYSVGKDPSSAKVVLQKLNESEVKSRTPSPEQAVSYARSHTISPISSLYVDNSSDSEHSNTSTNNPYASSRPRRKRAPVTLHEPSLKKKLRRNT